MPNKKAVIETKKGTIELELFADEVPNTVANFEKLALLLTLTLAVQDSGAFVARLGTDTLSLERYTRTGSQLRGEYVIRTPRTVHRIYTADLNPDGTIRRAELVTHNIGGGPGPLE